MSTFNLLFFLLALSLYGTDKVLVDAFPRPPGFRPFRPIPPRLIPPSLRSPPPPPTQTPPPPVSETPPPPSTETPPPPATETPPPAATETPPPPQSEMPPVTARKPTKLPHSTIVNP
ncbi:hypothetical protein R6Q59_024609 [Mikania micrantha]